MVTVALFSVALVACDRSAGKPEAKADEAGAALVGPAPTDPPAGAQSASEPAGGAQERGESTGPSVGTPEPSCPEGMILVPGGPFWVGSEHESFEGEENPRFLTRLAPFCLEETEVTVAAYAACVAAGQCSPARTEYKTCNAGRPDRADHPINCIDHPQATAYCTFRKGRLPSEIEWEYAARGGAEQRKYPWGNEPPDGRTCWKHHQSCPVKSFAAGAFGLHDVVGNVWEWTSDGFGPYPWPSDQAPHRVYRGGSWSRRFEKWMRPTLRNRYAPDHWGSHLGVRCAVTPDGVECPYGRDAETGLCKRGVEEAQCLGGLRWTGARCATAGAPTCPEEAPFVAGRGCLSHGPGSPPASARAAQPSRAAEATQESAAEKTPSEPVRRLRSPEFDADCAQNQPARPQAYRFEGGSHPDRNAAGRRHGCKNRDVGVGWNSACCP